MIHFVHVLHGNATRREIAQRAQAALADDFLGRLKNRGEDTAYAPAFVLDRAVREGEITFLDVSMLSEEKLQIIGPGGLSRIQHPL
jgi:hypothetical protein